VAKIFFHIYEFLHTKKAAFVVFLVLLVALLIFLSLKLTFEEDISKVIPQSEESKTLNKIIDNTNFSDNIILNISLEKQGEPDDLSLFAIEIMDSLESQCKNYIIKIKGKISDKDMQKTIDFVSDNLPLFLDQKDYDYINDQLSIDSIRSTVRNNYKTLISPSGIIAKNMIRKDPFGLSFRALKKLEDLKISDAFEIYNGFLTTNNKKNILLFIKPKLPVNETDANTLFVKKLYAISNDLNQKYKDKVSSAYYGSTVIAVGNANQIKTDIQYTVSIAMTVLLLLLILFYRRILAPFLLFLPTVFGALIAIVALYFIRGKISAISIGIGSVLLGITIDYSLHILTHFRNNNNIKQLYQDVAQPILMSSITTAIAFFCLLFLKTQVLQDLGIFAAISVLSTSVFALILIPLFYEPKEVKNVHSKNLIEKIAAYSFNKNKVLIVFLFIALIISFFTSKKVTFNKDLNQMNYQSEAMLKAEHNLDDILNLSSKSVYLVAYGDDMDDVLGTNTKINSLLKQEKIENNIIRYSSNGFLINSSEEQKSKINHWDQFWSGSERVILKADLIREGKKVGFKESTYQPFYQLLDKNFKEKDLQDFSNIESFLTDEYILDNKELKTAVSLVKINENKIDHLKEVIGKIPNVVLIDRKEISETFLGGLKDNFSMLIYYSFIAILLVLILFFKNIELTLLTVTPIAITWFLTLGLMGIFGIEFTIFNVIITTFIFGLGVDYSIFMTNALVKDYTYGTKNIRTYKVSIILSVITTILGVGVLIFAKHPALRSISVLSLIGIFTTVIVAFTIQPLLFQIFVTNRAKKGFSPIKLRQLLFSIGLLIFYGLGGIILSLIGLIILPIIPISKKIKFKALHIAAAKMVSVVLYTNPFVKKGVINEVNEEFKEPAIIIANHSSSLDTLTMGMLTHNIVYLVNDWVYRSPIFGILARVLGFYPVSNGVDDSLDHLKEKIRQGYSLMVFPEGKRSFTNKMGRFHKGAFFLQEQLKLDVLPVYLHGNAEVMPKNDFIIHDGSLTVKVGERIPYSNKEFGLSSRERSKKISIFFKSEFLKFRNEIEKDDYFKDILFSNYLFKEKEIQIRVKRDFEKNKSIYYTLNQQLPMKCNVLHVGNDLGQLDILLVARSLERKITSVIFDDKNDLIARNCYTSKQRPVDYLTSLDNVETKLFDVLLLSDKKVINSIKKEDLEGFKQIILVNIKSAKIQTINQTSVPPKKLLTLIREFMYLG